MLGHKANLGKYWVGQRVHLGNILQKNLNKLFGQPNIRILESYEVSFMSLILWGWKPNTKKKKKKLHKYKHMEIKQYVTKQAMNHWKTQRENQKIPTDIWKWNHNHPKPIGCRKSSSKKFTPYKLALRQQEKSQISNLTLHLKLPRKELQTKIQS